MPAPTNGLRNSAPSEQSSPKQIRDSRVTKADLALMVPPRSVIKPYPITPGPTISAWSNQGESYAAPRINHFAGAICAMKVPQFASSVLGAKGMYSAAIQKAP